MRRKKTSHEFATVIENLITRSWRNNNDNGNNKKHAKECETLYYEHIQEHKPHKKTRETSTPTNTIPVACGFSECTRNEKWNEWNQMNNERTMRLCVRVRFERDIKGGIR